MTEAKWLRRIIFLETVAGALRVWLISFVSFQPHRSKLNRRVYWSSTEIQWLAH